MKKQKNSEETYRVGVMLGLSKGEGEWPELENLSPSEKKDLRKIAKFNLFLDEGLTEAPDPSIIKEVTVVYDGITRVPSPEEGEEDFGLRIEDGQVLGRIRPILMFELTEEVDLEEFTRFVWGSSYELKPEAQEEPFYSEDWNGYTMILDEDDLEYWVDYLEEQGVYSGKTFTVEKLEKGVPATAFMKK